MSTQFAKSTRRMSKIAGWILLGFTLTYAYIVWTAPIDSIQGIIQKILYVHVPCAFSAYLGFLVTATCGALYLWKRDERFDQTAIAAAEVGVIFCTLVIITGPIWARGTWGAWWTWDPRLTVTLLLWFVYLAYLLLRNFTDGSERTARFASIYGIAGLITIPLNYFAIDLFGGSAMHPENLEKGSLGEGMGLPFLMGTLTSFSAFAYLLFLRIEKETLRMECTRRALEEESMTPSNTGGTSA